MIYDVKAPQSSSSSDSRVVEGHSALLLPNLVESSISWASLSDVSDILVGRSGVSNDQCSWQTLVYGELQRGDCLRASRPSMTMPHD